MLALFDRLGTPAAFFIEKEGRFVTPWGTDAAFLQTFDFSMYSPGGAHIGWWMGDHMRGHDGGIVLWALGATGLGVPLPRPYTNFSLPIVAPGLPASCYSGFTQPRPDRPPDKAAFSSTIFGAW